LLEIAELKARLEAEQWLSPSDEGGPDEGQSLLLCVRAARSS